MNHPKGEESTAVGESCSLTYHLSSTVLNCGGTQAPKHCGRGGHLRDGACAAGSVSFLPVLGGAGGKREPRTAILVGRAESDATDCSDRNDQLVTLVVVRVDGQRDEAVPGFRRQRLQRQPLSVAQLDLHVRALRTMARRIALDLPQEARDEIVERRLGGAREPHVGAQKSLESFAAAPTCSRPSSVMTRPRGVRCRYPSCRRYGS